MTTEHPEVLTTEQVATIFSVAETTVTKWRKAGKLKAIKLARNVVRFTRDDVTDFIRQQTK